MNNWKSVGVALALFACTAPAMAQGDGAPPMFPTPGEGDQVGLIAGLCSVQMKDMSPEACRCLGEQALTELSDPQRDYLIASAVSPPLADRMLEDRQIGQDDLRFIFTFLNDTMRTCHGGSFDPDAPPLPQQ